MGESVLGSGSLGFGSEGDVSTGVAMIQFDAMPNGVLLLLHCQHICGIQLQRVKSKGRSWPTLLSRSKRRILVPSIAVTFSQEFVSLLRFAELSPNAPTVLDPSP